MSKNNRKKVYTSKRKADKNGAFGKVMLSVIILGIVVLIFINTVLPIIKEKAKAAVAEKAVDVIAENVDKLADENEELQKISDSMTKEDRETVKEIVAEHMDAETVTEVMKYVNDGDRDGLINYAMENLSPEEMSRLAEIYSKYAE